MFICLCAVDEVSIRQFFERSCVPHVVSHRIVLRSMDIAVASFWIPLGKADSVVVVRNRSEEQMTENLGSHWSTGGQRDSDQRVSTAAVRTGARRGRRVMAADRQAARSQDDKSVDADQAKSSVF